MTPAFKGILWIALILALFAGSQKAHAEPEDRLQELVKGKAVVYVGSCWWTDKGVLTFKRAEMKRSTRCVVGMDLPDTTKHYVLIVGDRGNEKLVVYDEKTKTQQTLWLAGKEV